MRSAKRGKDISVVEVTNVSPHGFWLLVDGEEMLVTFDAFPWFRTATIGALSNVVLQGHGHLYWPELDIDLSLDSIEHPEKYPLVSRVAEPSTAKERYIASARRNLRS